MDLGLSFPLVQAPMAGAMDVELALAVAEAGGLASLPFGALAPERMAEQLRSFRAACQRPVLVNFFCHPEPALEIEREAAWRARLQPIMDELGVEGAPPSLSREPFRHQAWDAVEPHRPEVVSFHFGLPEAELLARVKKSGAQVWGCATSVEEARFLEERGCDAVIAQGVEAGGHRGFFLGPDRQLGTMALVPQVVDAVRIPVVAAGGIGDARGVRAARQLGARAVQLGTAYLFCPEARISAGHRQLLGRLDQPTVLTNVFTGRPARGFVNRLVRELGPMSELAPAYPRAALALAGLRAQAPEDWGPLWAGQAHGLGRPESADALTRRLGQVALEAG